MLLFWILRSAADGRWPCWRWCARCLQRPGARRDRCARRRGDADVAVYRDQLAEIEADRARGLISEAEARGARIEIARRLLASSSRTQAAALARAAGRQHAVPRRIDWRARLLTLVAVAVPAVAIGLYLVLGSPGTARPAGRRAPGQGAVGRRRRRRTGRPRRGADCAPIPADGQGWDVIAPVYLRLERFPRRGRRLSARASSSWARRRAGSPASPRACARQRRHRHRGGAQGLPATAGAGAGPHRGRFGLALAKEQDGDLDGAGKPTARSLERCAAAGALARSSSRSGSERAGAEVGRSAARRRGPAPAAARGGRDRRPARGAAARSSSCRWSKASPSGSRPTAGISTAGSG